MATDCALVAVDVATAGQWRRVLHTTNLASGSGRSAGGNSQNKLLKALGDSPQHSTESQALPSVLQEAAFPHNFPAAPFSKTYLRNSQVSRIVAAIPKIDFRLGSQGWLAWLEPKLASESSKRRAAQQNSRTKDFQNCSSTNFLCSLCNLRHNRVPARHNLLEGAVHGLPDSVWRRMLRQAVA